MGANIDLSNRVFTGVPVPIAGGILARFEQVEGLSGSAYGDILRGDDVNATTILTAGAQGSVLTNIDLINGLRAFIENSLGGPVTSFDGGNIIMGGKGGDLIEGRGATTAEDLRVAIERLSRTIQDAGGPAAQGDASPTSQRATTAMANLAEGIQGLVQHMRTEQQVMRSWVESQSEQQREIQALLETIAKALQTPAGE